MMTQHLRKMRTNLRSVSFLLAETVVAMMNNVSTGAAKMGARQNNRAVNLGGKVEFPFISICVRNSQEPCKLANLFIPYLTSFLSTRGGLLSAEASATTMYHCCCLPVSLTRRRRRPSSTSLTSATPFHDSTSLFLEMMVRVVSAAEPWS